MRTCPNVPTLFRTLSLAHMHLSKLNQVGLLQVCLNAVAERHTCNAIIDNTTVCHETDVKGLDASSMQTAPLL